MSPRPITQNGNFHDAYFRWSLTVVLLSIPLRASAAPFTFDDGTAQGWTGSVSAVDVDTDASTHLYDFTQWAENPDYPAWNIVPVPDGRGSIGTFVPPGGLKSPEGTDWLVATFTSPDLSGLADWQQSDWIDLKGGYFYEGVVPPNVQVRTQYTVFDQALSRDRTFTTPFQNATGETFKWLDLTDVQVSATLASANPPVGEYTFKKIAVSFWTDPYIYFFGPVLDNVIPYTVSPSAWIGGTGIWESSDSNWDSADEPDPDDSAIIRASRVTLGLNNEVAHLDVLGHSQLNLGTFSLQINGTFKLLDGELIAGEGSILNAKRAEVLGETSVSQIVLSGGIVRAGAIEIGSATNLEQNAYRSVIKGQGVLELASTVAGVPATLSNNGAIIADTGTIEIRGTGGGRIDLDGTTERGVLDVHDGKNDTAYRLVVSEKLSDTEFNGTIWMGSGESLEITSDDWSLGAGSQMIVGDSAAGVLAGKQVTQTDGSHVVIQPGAQLLVDAPFRMQGGTQSNAGRG